MVVGDTAPTLTALHNDVTRSANMTDEQVTSEKLTPRHAPHGPGEAGRHGESGGLSTAVRKNTRTRRPVLTGHHSAARHVVDSVFDARPGSASPWLAALLTLSPTDSSVAALCDE